MLTNTQRFAVLLVVILVSAALMSVWPDKKEPKAQEPKQGVVFHVPVSFNGVIQEVPIRYFFECIEDKKYIVSISTHGKGVIGESKGECDESTDTNTNSNGADSVIQD